MKINLICFVFFSWLVPLFAQNSWQSQLVYYDSSNRLAYVADSAGNRIPDFSYAGYRNSEVAIPEIPLVSTVSPLPGDNTAHLQAAIDAMASFPLDSAGFRGALFLEAGLYEIRYNLQVDIDGVVLRGAGDGDDPASNTILYATGNIPGKRDVLIAGGGASTLWADSVIGTRRNIVSDTVFVGERSFEITDASPFSVGDNIVMFHPCTGLWLQAIDYGGTFSNDPGADPEDIPWEVGSQPIVYNRYITGIQGNTITLDAPVFNTLVRSLSQSYIYKYQRQYLKTRIGIENLRIDIETAGGNDENHAWNGIYLHALEDGWVRNCTFLHFGQSGIYTNTATRITVENCRALDPVSIIDGGRRYNFNAYNASQLILFKDCHANNGRHSYVSNGTSYTSGIVFLDCTSAGAYAGSEGHRQWSQGLLYDNHRELDGPRPGYNPRRIGLYNRGYFGTSHGWSAAHSVAWNCDVHGGEIQVQQPPTAQNYAIGCFGYVTGQKPPCSFNVPEGYIEGTNIADLEPRSLFVAQLADRGGPLLAVEPEPEPGLSGNFKLSQNYPNPFNPATVISYQLSVASEVKLEIYNLLGEKIVNLVAGRQNPGKYQVPWNGRDQAERRVSSGVYLYRFSAGDFVQARKMILLK